jgi:hypothetical protein
MQKEKLYESKEKVGTILLCGKTSNILVCSMHFLFSHIILYKTYKYIIILIVHGESTLTIP